VLVLCKSLGYSLVAGLHVYSPHSSQSIPTSTSAPSSTVTTNPSATASPISLTSSVPVGAIVGGVIGGLVVLAGLVLFLFLDRRKRRRSAENPDGPPQPVRKDKDGGKIDLHQEYDMEPFTASQTDMSINQPHADPHSTGVGYLSAFTPGMVGSTTSLVSPTPYESSGKGRLPTRNRTLPDPPMVHDTRASTYSQSEHQSEDPFSSVAPSEIRETDVDRMLELLAARIDRSRQSGDSDAPPPVYR